MRLCTLVCPSRLVVQAPTRSHVTQAQVQAQCVNSALLDDAVMLMLAGATTGPAACIAVPAPGRGAVHTCLHCRVAVAAPQAGTPGRRQPRRGSVSGPAGRAGRPSSQAPSRHAVSDATFCARAVPRSRGTPRMAPHMPPVRSPRCRSGHQRTTRKRRGSSATSATSGANWTRCDPACPPRPIGRPGPATQPYRDPAGAFGGANPSQRPVRSSPAAAGAARE